MNYQRGLLEDPNLDLRTLEMNLPAGGIAADSEAFGTGFGCSVPGPNIEEIWLCENVVDVFGVVVCGD